MNETYKFGTKKIGAISDPELEQILPLVNEKINTDFLLHNLKWQSVNYFNIEALKNATIYASRIEIEAHDDTHIFYDLALAVNGETLRISRFYFWEVDGKISESGTFEHNAQDGFVQTDSFVFDF